MDADFWFAWRRSVELSGLVLIHCAIAALGPRGALPQLLSQWRPVQARMVRFCKLSVPEKAITPLLS